ncbi:MAG: AbrB/MazE/SpoVT family DNA-binding domain-containing protein [Deltaproteobacteria bacterium]|nr:AbrB/MazE/SpoVT family DNA-binding domain-containing protein [Deltaproteobacteria bacterium]
MGNVAVYNPKVTASGQISLLKDIREAFGVRTGGRVTLIRQDD